MKVRITYLGENNTIYSVVEEHSKIELGSWKKPFPNEQGSSTALGLEECLLQSDYCPLIFREEGLERIEVIKIN